MTKCGPNSAVRLGQMTHFPEDGGIPSGSAKAGTLSMRVVESFINRNGLRLYLAREASEVLQRPAFGLH